MHTHIKLKYLLKSKKMPESLKKEINKHPILGLKQNKDEIYFKLINYKNDKNHFYLFDKFIGDFVPLFQKSDLSDYIKTANEKVYNSSCFICGKKHNDTLDAVFNQKENERIKKMKDQGKIVYCGSCNKKHSVFIACSIKYNACDSCFKTMYKDKSYTEKRF